MIMIIYSNRNEQAYLFKVKNYRDYMNSTHDDSINRIAPLSKKQNIAHFINRLRKSVNQQVTILL